MTAELAWWWWLCCWFGYWWHPGLATAEGTECVEFADAPYGGR